MAVFRITDRLAAGIGRRQTVFVNRAEIDRATQRDRNVVEDLNDERTGTERDAVAIAVLGSDVRRQIDPGYAEQVFGVVAAALLRAVQRRMVDLVEQRELKGTIRSDRQREDQATIGIAFQQCAVGLDEDLGVLGEQTGCLRRKRCVEAEAAEAIRAEVNEPIQRTRTAFVHVRIRAGYFAVAIGVDVRVGQRRGRRIAAGVETILVNVCDERAARDQGRTVVAEHNTAGDVGIRLRDVVVAILDGDARLQNSRQQRNFVVGIRGVRMLQREILHDRDLTCGRIDRDGECRLAGESAGVDTADNQAAFLKQRHRGAVRGAVADLYARRNARRLIEIVQQQ